MRFLLAFAASSVCAALVVGACGDPSHIYEAYPYLADQGCLGRKTSLDVVEGAPAGECEAVCFVKTETNGQRSLLVSRMCGPYPYALDRSGTDPGCVPALAALARGDVCLADGGSTAPLPKDAAAD